MKKLTIEEVQEEALNRYGLTLLSNEYKNDDTIMKWMDNDTGSIFFRRWNAIKNGQTTPLNTNSYIADKHKIEYYKNLGYKYNQTEEQYLSARKRAANRLFVIEHPLLSEPWVTTMSAFIRSAESYLNQSGMSYGEQVIHSTLNNNKIQFKFQYRVKINNKMHRFDFYLPNYNLFIEYDGKQHFYPVEPWGGDDALKDRKMRDKEKDEYVSSIGALILRINYTSKTANDIVRLLSTALEKDLIIGQIYNNPDKIQDVAKYYNAHTSRQTIDKYHVGRTTISRYYHKTYGMSKKQRREVLQR